MEGISESYSGPDSALGERVSGPDSVSYSDSTLGEGNSDSDSHSDSHYPILVWVNNMPIPIFNLIPIWITYFPNPTPVHSTIPIPLRAKKVPLPLGGVKFRVGFG